jgi:hypothetical protein
MRRSWAGNGCARRGGVGLSRFVGSGRQGMLIVVGSTFSFVGMR